MSAEADVRQTMARVGIAGVIFAGVAVIAGAAQEDASRGEVLGIGVAYGEIIPAQGGEITLAVGRDGYSAACADPVATQDGGELAVCRLFFEPLYVAGADGRVAPRLALGPPQWSKDRRRATIALAPNIVLHDGRLLTATDVATSLLRARAAGRLDVGAVVADDALRTVELQFAKPPAQLMDSLSAPWLSIAVAGTGADAGAARWIGSGPFLRRVAPAPDIAIAERFDGYWRGPARLARIVLVAPPTPAEEARRYHRGKLAWARVGADDGVRELVATGLPPAYPGVVVRPPLAEHVELLGINVAWSAAQLSLAVDYEALRLALPYARVLMDGPVTAERFAGGELDLAHVAAVQPVPLYYPAGDRALAFVAAKLVWQLGQQQMPVHAVPLAALDVAGIAARGEAALMLRSSARCMACTSATSGHRAADQAVVVSLFWYGNALEARASLTGWSFDGWAAPAWEQLAEGRP